MLSILKTLAFAASVTATVFFINSCEEDAAAPPSAKGSTSFAFITTTDYQTGSSSTIWFDGTHSTDQNVAAVHSDAVPRYFDGLIYVVNRFGGDNIQVLDPSNGFGAVRQFSLDNRPDPHDILVINETKAYVTLYNSTELLVMNPSNGIHTGTIDLSSLADGDGIPEMDRMLRIDDRVFVSIQRLDRNTQFWDPVGESYVAVVDITTDELVDTDDTTAGIQPIVATGFNPFSTMDIDPASGRLCVAMVGKWGTADGGVEMINRGEGLRDLHRCELQQRAAGLQPAERHKDELLVCPGWFRIARCRACAEW
jgi:hypothetical protein